MLFYFCAAPHSADGQDRFKFLIKKQNIRREAYILSYMIVSTTVGIVHIYLLTEYVYNTGQCN